MELINFWLGWNLQRNFWLVFMCIDDEKISIRDEPTLVGSLHQCFIFHIHVWTPKHDSTYIKGNHIQIYFINKINTDNKSNFALFSYLQLYISFYPSQWIWVWVVTNFQSQLLDQLCCNEIRLRSWVKQSINFCLLDLYVYVEEFDYFFLIMLLKDT